MVTVTIDWELIEKDWKGGKFTSLNALATHHGVSRQGIQKKAKKEEWGDFVKAEEALVVTTVTTDEKSFLGPIALRKIEEIIKELGSHYSQVDEPMIVCFAKTYERLVDLEKKMDGQPEVIMNKKKGTGYINPMFIAIQMTQKTLVTIGGQLGLSIYSRKRIGMNLGEHRGQGELDIYENAAERVKKLIGTTRV